MITNRRENREMITRDDRLSEVLGRNDQMLQVIESAAPQLRGLRNPVTRKVMGRLATIAQVARLAGIEPDVLVRRINRALEEGGSDAGGRSAGDAESHAVADPAPEGQPGHLAALPPERIEELDVREDLRKGREPFSRIMQARAALRSGSVLRLRATFEPIPLYAVMARQGFEHWTERLDGDDWRVWFYPPAMASEEGNPGGAGVAPAEPVASPAEGRADSPIVEGGEGVVVLDVRGLDPPEPLVRTLAALESLTADATLVQVNERVPQHLLPRLAELGFEHSIREDGAGVVRVFIRRPRENPAD